MMKVLGRSVGFRASGQGRRLFKKDGINSINILCKAKRAARIGAAIAAAVIGTGGVAAAQGQSYNVNWSSNPFGYALSDELFLGKGEHEYRFEKAVRVMREAGGGIGDDLKDIFAFPFQDPRTFGIMAASVGALTLFDVQTTTWYQENLVPIGKRLNPRYPNVIPFVGGDGNAVLLGIGATYAFGVMANDERAQVAAVLSAKAVAYSYLTSHLILKTAFGRSRPVPNLASHTGPTGVYSKSPFEFFNSTGLHFKSEAAGTGMPSFHFTMYYSTARVYAGVYDNWVVPYGVATAIALASAEGHNHWVSEMAAGALVGTVIGNVVLSNYDGRKRALMGSVMPVVSSKGVGVQFQLKF